ncbi:unnamed protein product [Polarella glacialis]|uniref:Uncharacterized protein n=1 Tax=Polarella glacialis TaxID=89957 RepID=A0A813K0G8_POLGL|nr:unnamed protein product [Polarella glacialis]CAE8688108.1 unnamed protein product [Polarella glacialis]CAE8701692.1 unnamed protein product [Polarella glacialis]
MSLPPALAVIWSILGEECSPACLNLLEPHLGVLVRAADVAGQQGDRRLRDFLRCLGQLHERAEQAEAAAKHWETQWTQAFRHVLDQRQDTNSSSLGYEVELRELREALAGVSAERDRLACIVRGREEELRTAERFRLQQELSQEDRLRLLDAAAHRRVRAGDEEYRKLEQRHFLESAVTGKLKEELRQLRLELSELQLERAQAKEQAASAKQYALDARSFVAEQLEEALEKQRKDLTQQLHLVRGAHQEELSGVIPRTQAAAVLGSFAELWRCGSTQHPGLHGRRAEQAVRELLRLGVGELLPPQGELIQEPLRRAVGDELARRLGDELACKLYDEGSAIAFDAPRDGLAGWAKATDGSELAVLRRHLPLRNRGTVLASENR